MLSPSQLLPGPPQLLTHPTPHTFFLFVFRNQTQHYQLSQTPQSSQRLSHHPKSMHGHAHGPPLHTKQRTTLSGLSGKGCA